MKTKARDHPQRVPDGSGWLRKILLTGPGTTPQVFTFLGYGWGGGMITFLALIHMLNATQLVWGGGGMITFLPLVHMLNATQLVRGGGGMITFLALVHIAVRSRQFKYGTCPVHNRAMRVTVGYSGVYAGRPCVRCPLFWEKTEDGKPSCWQQGPCRVPMEELPRVIRAKVQELKQEIRWSLRHGPSTR